MTPAQRLALIRQRLQDNFSPSHLEIQDDSEKHRGHAGSQGGAGHYTVIIASASFAQQARMEAHRAIYRVLDDLIPQEIHALQIKIL